MFLSITHEIRIHSRRFRVIFANFIRLFAKVSSCNEKVTRFFTKVKRFNAKDTGLFGGFFCYEDELDEFF